MGGTTGGGLAQMYAAMDGTTIEFASQDVTENFSFSNENGVSKVVRSGDFSLYNNFFNASIFSDAVTGEYIGTRKENTMVWANGTPRISKYMDITPIFIPNSVKPSEIRGLTEAIISSGGIAAHSEFQMFSPVFSSDVRSKTYTGTAPVPGLKKIDPKKLFKLGKTLYKSFSRGHKNVPRKVKDVHYRFDVNQGKVVHGQKPHVHLKDGRALNLDGTWKHGSGDVTKDIKTWINTAIELM